MAPSSRKTRASSSIIKTQQNVKTLSFGRVTKASQLNVQLGKLTDAKKAAVVHAFEEEEKDDEIKLEQPVEVQHKKLVKRKRSESEDEEDENENEKLTKLAYRPAGVKKPKLQLLSPPSSQPSTDTESSSPIKSEFQTHKLCPHNRNLPSTLQDLVSLYTAFLQALSLHYAHNGPSTPAELNSLMYSMTRIWKKSAVKEEMIQRMLALYEIAADSSLSTATVIPHNRAPFKLVRSGFGSSIRTNLEFVRGSNAGTFQEYRLQTDFESLVRTLFSIFESDSSSFVHQDQSQFPLLLIAVGAQTQARQEKASSTRNEILQLSNAAQSRAQLSFSSLTLSDPVSESTPAAVKSRTSSLFDRVRAKGLAASTNSAPTSQQILRRHAIGRLAEVVEFLRMKQQQKQSSHFHSSIHDSPSKVRAKISFSLNTIVNEIRQSVAIPIGDEELRCCIKILSQAVPNWLTCFELGSVTSVTLTGSGASGIEVKKLVEEAEKRS